MEKAIFDSLVTAVKRISDRATVRYGYLSEVQEQTATMPLVVMTPMNVTLDAIAVGVNVLRGYQIKVMFLFPDSYGKAVDTRAGGNLGSRLDAYNQAQELAEAVYNQLALDFGTTGKLAMADIQPLQNVGSQTLTGKLLTCRLAVLSGCYD